MKIFSVLRKEKNNKRRDIARREQELLSANAKEQFRRLTEWGLPISVSI